MSAAPAIYARDPRTRFEGGFDRWSYASRSGWLILWHGSEQASYALGDGRSVWVWDEEGRLWNRLPGDEAHSVYREHERTLRRLRRAVLVVKLLNSKVPGEREAARSALQRIGSAVVEDWRFGRSSRSTEKGFGWFDHPAAVYLAVTQDCRLHLHERERMPFDAAVFAALVANAQEDFTAGRRAEPPRLRPADLVHLQANVASADGEAAWHPGDAGQHPDSGFAEGAESPSRKAESDRIVDVRRAAAAALEDELIHEAQTRRKRCCAWLVSGSLAAGAVLVVAMLGLH